MIEGRRRQRSGGRWAAGRAVAAGRQHLLCGFLSLRLLLLELVEKGMEGYDLCKKVVDDRR